MAGGLMQLVAYGAQDVYLTSDPKITFFKVLYRRHTNFSVEVVEHTLNGTPDFGRKSTVTISRNGDLITNMYLRVVLPEVRAKSSAGRFAWVRRIGHALVNNVEVEIGGSRIDKHYGTWMDIWYELSHSVGKERGYNAMIGDVPALTQLSTPNASLVVKPSYTLFVPLQFWFCRNNGLALPLIALQYHEVRVNIEFNPLDKLYIRSSDFLIDNGVNLREVSLLVDYVYLDGEERRRMAQAGHEYLIEQLQFTGEESATTTNVKTKLGFNHPTKEIVWAIRNGNFNPSSASRGRSFLAYTHDDANWSAALQDAANNLANNMLIATLVAGAPTAVAQWQLPGVPPTVNDYIVAGPATVITPATYEFGNTVAAAAIGGAGVWTGAGGHNVTVVTSIGTGAIPVNMGLYIRKGVLTYNSVDLSTFVSEVTVEVGTVTGIPYWVAVASRHTLTQMEYLSLPVTSYIDNRTQTNGSGVNQWDLVVWQWSNYGMLIDGSLNPVSRGLIQFNGLDRFDEREGAYFNYVQPQQHHSRTPADGVNLYSFALHPEQHQPSGTANLSRIDNCNLNLTMASQTVNGINVQSLNSDTKLFIYAVNYNVLRVLSGMGGLAYSS